MAGSSSWPTDSSIRIFEYVADGAGLHGVHQLVTTRPYALPVLDPAELTPRTTAWLMAAPRVPEMVTLESLLRRPAWMAQAACRGEPPETFFPGRGASINRAKAICARCPVQDPCAAYAIADPDIQGIWAGATHRGRGALRRSAR